MIKLKQNFLGDEQLLVVDWLASQIQLSKVKIKHTIGLGGLWIQKKGQKKKRVKRIKTFLEKGDRVEFFHDPRITGEDHPEIRLIQDFKSFAVWYKPASVMVDSSPFGDKGTLASFILKSHKRAHIINRLDYPVSGLLLVAYTKEASRELSEQLRLGIIKKEYLAIATGEVKDGEITKELDGKKAKTLVRVEKVKNNLSYLSINIETGRYHQIRRHLNMIGHPLLGDPQYGKNNKDESGLKLQAVGLCFKHHRKWVEVTLPNELRIY